MGTQTDVKGGCTSECDVEKILIPRSVPNTVNKEPSPSASTPGVGQSVSQEQIKKEANDRMMQPPPSLPLQEEGDDSAVERI